MSDNMKRAAYLIWEVIEHDNALAVWRCAECMSVMLERIGVHSSFELERVVKRGIYHQEYIEFVRKIAYLLYLHTGNDDLKNWYGAEKLIQNAEWRAVMSELACECRKRKFNLD